MAMETMRHVETCNGLAIVSYSSMRTGRERWLVLGMDDCGRAYSSSAPDDGTRYAGAMEPVARYEMAHGQTYAHMSSARRAARRSS